MAAVATRVIGNAKSVVIIGGGVSGLVAGSKLTKLPEFQVILLEGTDQIGGRVSTARFGKGTSSDKEPSTVELGAQWIHGEIGNPIYALLSPFGVLVDDKIPIKFGSSGVTFVTQNGEFLPENLGHRIGILMDSMTVIETDTSEHPISESLGHYTSQIFWKQHQDLPFSSHDGIAAGLLDWIHRFQNSIDGSDSWFVTSRKGQLDYTTCDGNPTVEWKHPASYATLLRTILNGTPSNGLPKDIEIPNWIKLNTEVTEIDYHEAIGNAKKIVIRCKNGEEFTADHVICTPSLGVLQKTHHTLFKPSLSVDRIKAIQNIGFGTVDKIFLEFESHWWPKDICGFNLIWDDCCNINTNWMCDATSDQLLDEIHGIPVWCRSLLGFYTLPNQTNTLFTWITGKPAEIMELLDLEKLNLALVKVLDKFLGSVFRVSPPSTILRSKWATNPFTTGSYSFRSVSTEVKGVGAVDLAKPIVNNSELPIICFAGEHTHSSYYSTVHGAYESGLREADRLITAMTPLARSIRADEAN